MTTSNAGAPLQSTAPTPVVGTTSDASPTSGNNNNAGGCVVNGRSQSIVNDDSNLNRPARSLAGTVRINHLLLVGCIILVAWVVMVRGDNNSAGGCNFLGGNNTDTNCNNNNNGVPKASTASTAGVDFRWLALLCIVLNLGVIVGADDVSSGPVGGCQFNGGTVQGVNCANNTVINSPASTPDAGSGGTGLSGGAIAGIVLGVLPALAALLAIGAMIVHRDATVMEGKNRTLLRHFKREPWYRIVEGCTLGFGCHSLRSLERCMANWVIKGGKRMSLHEMETEAATPPEMAGTN